MRMVKQVLRLSAVCLACLIFSGCSLDARFEVSDLFHSESTPTDVTTTTLPSVEVPLIRLENGFAYSRLGKLQQENYEAVVDALYERRGQDTHVEGLPALDVILPHALRSEQEIEQLFAAVYDDHPEFFYLSPRYGWMTLGEYYIALHIYYVWDADERAIKAAELEAAVSSLVAQAQGMTAVEQELFFHDTLIERCEYNEVAAQEIENETISEAYYIASSPYAALCSGDPICGGYSRAFQLLLSRVGVPNTAVDNETHTWTMVWLGEEAYHVDVTWDDPVSGEEQYLYFNITDEEIRASRDYPEQRRLLPEAIATQYNYYVMNGWYFADAFDETLDDCIRAQIESGKDTVDLKFAPDAFMDAGSLLFDDEGFFGAVYELEDDTLRDRWYNPVLFEEKEELGTIRIYLDE